MINPYRRKPIVKKSVSIYKVRSFSTIATHMLVYNKNYYKSTAAPHDKPGGFKEALFSQPNRQLQSGSTQELTCSTLIDW